VPLIWRLSGESVSHRLDGEESSGGGRWNSAGRQVIYCSSSLALAAFECFVHFDADTRRDLPKMKAVLIWYPNDAAVRHVSRQELPADLACSEADAACRAIGDSWADENAALALIAPSVVIEHESNVMLNVRHPRMAEVRVEDVREFRWDDRLRG
jgi:RES domain-containing protein